MRSPLFLFIFVAFLAPQTVAAEMSSATDKIVEKFMELDFDESTTVSFEEYELMVLDRLNNRFIQMDANGDDEVSEEEYRNFWTEQKSQYYRPRR